VASFFAILASQLSGFTGCEDGLTYKLPQLLRPGTKLLETPLFGVDINGRIVSYYIVFFTAAALFLALLRVVNSPFGRVLQAIRENDFRAEAIGYRSVIYRSVANCVAALAASAAGILYALWLRYAGPDTTLSFDIMIDILLMVVIGGMGTMYGAVVGATLFVIAQTYLQDLMKLASDAAAGIPLLPGLVHPDRWLLWLGILFILSVYRFPTGIVGKLRGRQ
jgi:branched-chain amino acid transport system permease protein